MVVEATQRHEGRGPIAFINDCPRRCRVAVRGQSFVWCLLTWPGRFLGFWATRNVAGPPLLGYRCRDRPFAPG